MTDATYDNLVVEKKARSQCDAPRLYNVQIVADIQPGNAGGSRGYTSAPSVTFSGGGGGSGATATASISNGTVTAINVTNPGSSYTSAPYVTISGPGSGAVLSASIYDYYVTGVTVTSGGSGYTFKPKITFSGGGGYEAAAEAEIQGSVAFVEVTDGGFGYTSAPTVNFSGGEGSGAVASATISGLGKIIVTNGGSDYTSPPSVSFSSGSATAVATVMAGKVIDVTITDPGSNYASNPTVSFSGGGGSGAEATAIAAIGCVTGVTVTNGGSDYTSDPFVTFSGGNGERASAKATITGTITSVQVTNGGNGYTSAPSVSVSGQPATAIAFIAGGNVLAVLLTSKLPTGSNGIKFMDNATGSFLNLFPILSSENDNAPLLATEQGLIVKKDFQAGGFLGSQQGAVMLNHGLKGRPIVSSPPCIQLMDSALQYPSGATLPNNPEIGQLFTHNGTEKMWDGDAWIEGNFTGNYDTLFLFKYDGITPAHLDLGNLTAHGYVYTNDLSPVPDQEWIDVNSKLRIHGDLQLVNGRVASSLNPADSGFGLGSGDEPWDGVVAVSGYFDTLYLKGSEGYYPVSGLNSMWGVMIATEEGGTMNPTGQQFVNAGYILQVAANPDASYSFDHWVLDGDTYYTNPITIPGQEGGTVHSLQCVFTYNPSPPPYWQTFTVNYLGCEESVETNDAALIDESYQRSETITIENS